MTSSRNEFIRQEAVSEKVETTQETNKRHRKEMVLEAKSRLQAATEARLQNVHEQEALRSKTERVFKEYEAALQAFVELAES